MARHTHRRPSDKAITSIPRPMPSLPDTDTIAERCDMLIEILQQNPAAKDARLLLVSLLDAAGAQDEALLVMAQGIDYHDRDAEIYVRLGEMLTERGQVEDAFNAFEIAISLAPEAGVLQRALGCLVCSSPSRRGIPPPQACVPPPLPPVCASATRPARTRPPGAAAAFLPITSA
jgi:Flp pilus assembly protein TadD